MLLTTINQFPTSCQNKTNLINRVNNTQKFKTMLVSKIKLLCVAMIACFISISFNTTSTANNGNANPELPAAVLKAVEGYAWVARHGMTGSSYQSYFNSYTNKGYRLVHVNGYTVSGKARFTAIWAKKSGGAYVARHGMSATKYQSEFNKWTKKGYRLTCISGYEEGGQARYAAIFEKKSGAGWYAYHGMSSSKLFSKNNELRAKGYAPTFVDGYTVNGKAYFAAIWVKGANNKIELRMNQTSSQYQATFNACTRQGYRPVTVSAYKVGGTIRYVSLFVKKSGSAFYAYHGLTSSSYQSKFNSLTKKGFKLKYVNGCGTGSDARYAAIFEK